MSSALNESTTSAARMQAVETLKAARERVQQAARREGFDPSADPRARHSAVDAFHLSIQRTLSQPHVSGSSGARLEMPLQAVSPNKRSSMPAHLSVLQQMPGAVPKIAIGTTDTH